jgi:diguanylate cyclase (GGDEF)-like protein/PAS domain S-box-containing protein
MNKRTVFFTSVLMWFGVVILTLLWEFAVEDWVAPFLIPSHEVEPLRERWEYVVTSAVFAILALIGPTILSLEVSRRRQMAVQELRNSETRFKDFAETAADWFWETDADLRFSYLSARFGHIAGLPTHELLGKIATKIVPGQIVDEKIFEKHADSLRTRQTFAGFEFHWVRPDGNILVLRICGRPVFDEHGTFQGYRGSGTDITEANREIEKIAHDAAHDALTGLVNRREFEKRLERALASARRSGSQHALCFIDLDRFKRVNDAAGHIAGDQLLKQVKDILVGKFRERDTLARLGGDEFGLLLEHCNLNEAVKIGKKIVETLQAHRFTWAEANFNIGASVGVVPVAPEAMSVGQLLADADMACYSAKRRGGSCLEVYRPRRLWPN